MVAMSATIATSSCLYLDGVNQRPEIQIERTSIATITPLSKLDVRAVVDDPEDGDVTLTWQWSACAEVECDSPTFIEGPATEVTILVPAETEGRDPVQRLVITLDGRDDRGAAAKSRAVLELEVSTAPILRMVNRLAVVHAPVVLRVQRDRLAQRTQWRARGPSTQGVLRALASPSPSIEQQELVPDAIGRWEVEVEVTDRSGASSTARIEIDVAADRPPCLAILAPAIPAMGDVLVLDQPRRFAALLVSDDLDPYPSTAGPPEGGAVFQWSLQAPSRGTGLVVLAGAVGHAAELDPSTLQAGEQIELRVEVADRIARSLCAASAASCALAENCVQRQTWKMEVR